MAYFKSAKELEEVIGGFLQTFPRMEPLMREAVGHQRMILKLELSDPELMAEVDFTKSPMQVRLNSQAEGTVGMTCSADTFHQLLLGMLSLGVGVDGRKLLLRGSVARMMNGVALFYLAPSIYPFYLESKNRKDLMISGKRPLLHAEKKLEGSMSKLISGLAFLAGYGLGLVKKYLAKNLDIVAALEAMGKGLLRATQ